MQTKVLIVGASISGLAMAACLRRKKVDFAIIEKQAGIGAPWRHHYERLHLHTNKRVSGLPYRKWSGSAPRYPSRLEVIDYLENYRQAFDIQPQFETEARSVRKEKEAWVTETNKSRIDSRYVVMATGAYGRPKSIKLPGQEGFPGRLLHSYEYRTGTEFAGQRVLVVGFGNSACEIAMDLVEQGASASMAVRSAVNIIPRNIFGIPVLELSQLLRFLPPRLGDIVSSPLLHWAVGDLGKLGLSRKAYGPLQQIVQEGKAPVLDIGVVRLIREGRIRVFSGVGRIMGDEVAFLNGERGRFDAIIAGIGYDRNYDAVLEVNPRRFEDLRMRIDKQRFFGEEGLYFCGYWISPTGQIREIARDAKRITADILRRG